MDESALFFKLLPDRMLAFKGETCNSGKHAKDRISVAFGVNMMGTEELPLLAIRKSANPRCFKGAQLPSGVVYRSNTKAWTAKLFEEYMRLIDCCFSAAHVGLDNRAALKLVFLPPNTSAITQPLDQGVIQAVKQLYKKNLQNRILQALECGKVFAIGLLGASHLLECSWWQVESTVQNYFKHTSFQCVPVTRRMLATPSTKLVKHCLLKCRSGRVLQKAFPSPTLDIDSVVQTSPDMSDEAIVASVMVEVLPNYSNEDDTKSDSTGYSGLKVAKAAPACFVQRQRFAFTFY
ncbi:tigger transposable element-derived protein 4-like [Dermacentor silvarum]|uniref:tigger transposable element-derived protein 4-like n=1 Tax=Dermacentor silvarum TaxID=543639 RepID=UPI001898CE49|nr:tigger transposable element-derived protein 4-like [Dermacentor silvarum]XP_049515915.1 tigger transposable element-derived protein 4-like [Dermacentor silvarum]